MAVMPDILENRWGNGNPLQKAEALREFHRRRPLCFYGWTAVVEGQTGTQAVPAMDITTPDARGSRTDRVPVVHRHRPRIGRTPSGPPARPRAVGPSA